MDGRFSPFLAHLLMDGLTRRAQLSMDARKDETCGCGGGLTIATRNDAVPGSELSRGGPLPALQNAPPPAFLGSTATGLRVDPRVHAGAEVRR